ncbi:MAG: hypothetical protein NT080_11240 [Spirochaetes bacterium]|nr:hypothetical protein [Spirochaetota bacterium]
MNLSWFCLMTVIAAAQPAANFVPAALLDRLAAGEDLRAVQTGKIGTFSFAPNHPEVRLVADALAMEKPDVVVETLFFWRKPFVARNELLAAYNVFRAMGTLEGVEYWSASRKKMRLFYEKSYRIAGPTDRTSVKDVPVLELPTAETIFAFQKDLTFGGNVYRYDFRTSRDSILVESTNLTGLSYGPVPIAGPGKVRTRILVVATEEGMLFWACSSASATILPGVRGRLESSFGNRAEAVFGWFSAKAQEAWKAAGRVEMR